MNLETLAVSVADYIATVTINRPPVNARNNKLREEMQLVMDSLGDRTDVRAIVMTGEGKAFSAGADLSERPTHEPGTYTAHNRRVMASFDCIMLARSWSWPIILWRGRSRPSRQSRPLKVDRDTRMKPVEKTGDRTTTQMAPSSHNDLLARC